MNKNLLAGGCSFTFGHELSDDKQGQIPSRKSWSALLAKQASMEYRSVAFPGTGNSGIARRVFEQVCSPNFQNTMVAIMWTFTSRYDWAMPRNALLENTRWTSITPWDTEQGRIEAEHAFTPNESHLVTWKQRSDDMQSTGVGPFAESLYRHAANQYHETYLSWKSIVWLQNILEKKKIPYFFTLSDNILFYDKIKPLKEIDILLHGLYNEINFNNWYFFGERKMGFNQWAMLNSYPRGTTHPLDSAHDDAAKLMRDHFMAIYNRRR